LKKALEPVLPKNILYRPKQGFAIPLDVWFRKELKDLAYNVILETDDGILDKKFLKKIWDEHQKGYYDRSALLWATLMFRKWRQVFAA
jgi:asparagine synthase (glutamine-hydrolysing)